MLRSSSLLAGLVALLFAHPAVAQVTEKEVIAEVKAAGKAQLKAFKQNIAAALSTLDANLKGAEALLAEDADAITVGAHCGNTAIVFITTLNEDFAQAKAFVDVELRFPSRPEAISINDETLVSAARGVTLDVIVSASDMDVPDDGVLIFAKQGTGGTHHATGEIGVR